MSKTCRAFFLFFLISLIFAGGLCAQESEEKTGGLNAGYDTKGSGGFYTQSNDGALKMNLGGYSN